ncbi:hypothetical protein LIER_33344 [Lithospermum erythrorhizon]|uniref:Uncharacterized protein n=1 Tax=Lithospermum erythrorhizon TaxID=34254 RepID=A0AAV3S207_LITER
MANNSIVGKLVIFFFILSYGFLISEGRVLQTTVPLLAKDIIGKEKLWRKIGFSVADLEYFKRRSLNADVERVAPGGPDPHHHSLPTIH